MDYRNQILQGDCLEVLKDIPDGIVNCCVTSPPYYGLRDYGTGTWVGGDADCPHRRTSKYSEKTITGHGQAELAGNVGDAIYKAVCPLCGAVRVDKQIGLEETPDEYIDKLVRVFREVKRVLTDDGTLWINIGDTYNGAKKGNTEINKHQNVVTDEFEKKKWAGAKEKDLIGIPWMLAFALRADGWYLRQDIIWQKPNPMPESVKDRCTKSHEYIFLLAKNSHYYFDYEAIQEESKWKDDPRAGEGRIAYEGKRTEGGVENTKAQESFVTINEKRNKRDVWNVAVSAISEAHFATYPEKLIEPCILAGCPKGGLVLDPFFGSGTTGRVAIGLDRDYLGIELNPEYIEIANRRTDGVQTTLFC